LRQILTLGYFVELPSHALFQRHSAAGRKEVEITNGIADFVSQRVPIERLRIVGLKRIAYSVELW
jgi:hypothetical protein